MGQTSVCLDMTGKLKLALQVSVGQTSVCLDMTGKLKLGLQVNVGQTSVCLDTTGKLKLALQELSHPSQNLVHWYNLQTMRALTYASV